MKNPFKLLVNIRRAEIPFAATMFAHFFLIIASFWVLKPLKKGLFIEHYDVAGLDLLGLTLRASQAELLAKVANMIVAFFAMAVFGWMSQRLRRQELTVAFLIVLQLGFALFAFLLQEPGTGTVWTFYLFGDLYNMIMLASFFAFLNDSVTPDQAKRMYGVVVLGGVVGGVFGSTVVRTWIGNLSPSSWIWIVFGAGIVVGVLAVVSGIIVDRRPVRLGAWRREEHATAKRESSLAGARLVFKSRYLLAVAAIVGLYEVVSSMADFQFTETVAHYLDGHAIREHLSTVYMITNALSMGVQLLATSFVMSRFGVGRALMILPAAILLFSAGYLAVPVLWMGSFLSIADNGLNYSMNQSAKEALYVPLGRVEKYGAKAFIDIFVQRFAKALGVGIGLILTIIFSEFTTTRWLSVIVVMLVLLWLMVARFAGMKFNLYSREESVDGSDREDEQEEKEKISQK